MKKIALFTLSTVFFLCSLSLNAVDFGLVFSQNVESTVPTSNFEGSGFDNITSVLLPRFSAPLVENGYLYISGAINYEAAPSNGINSNTVIPELTRSTITLQGEYVNFNIGRMLYGDPLGITANGLFDGAQFSFITRKGNIRVGGWYTGLLYKERAAITMTPDELKSSKVKVDYDDFANTYYAPRRILAALDYDHPSLAGFIGLKTSIITQFDTSDEKLNSQYFTAAFTVPIKSLIFDLGGCLELIEYKDETNPAFSADIGITYILPTKLEKHIKLSARYSSGVSDDKTIAAFLPITTAPQGNIIQAKLSALTLLSLDFTGRLAKSLSVNTAFTYFIRNDLATYKYYPITYGTSDGFLLGAEIFGKLVWNITSGIRLNFGTGLFIPSLGDAAPDADILWRTKLNMVISIF